MDQVAIFQRLLRPLRLVFVLEHFRSLSSSLLTHSAVCYRHGVTSSLGVTGEHSQGLPQHATHCADGKMMRKACPKSSIRRTFRNCVPWATISEIERCIRTFVHSWSGSAILKVQNRWHLHSSSIKATKRKWLTFSWGCRTQLQSDSAWKPGMTKSVRSCPPAVHTITRLRELSRVLASSSSWQLVVLMGTLPAFQPEHCGEGKCRHVVRVKEKQSEETLATQSTCKWLLSGTVLSIRERKIMRSSLGSWTQMSAVQQRGNRWHWLSGASSQFLDPRFWMWIHLVSHTMLCCRSSQD